MLGTSQSLKNSNVDDIDLIQEPSSVADLKNTKYSVNINSPISSGMFFGPSYMDLSASDEKFIGTVGSTLHNFGQSISKRAPNLSLTDRKFVSLANMDDSIPMFDKERSLRKSLIEFNQVVPNFVSKHVREWCDKIVYPALDDPITNTSKDIDNPEIALKDRTICKEFSCDHNNILSSQLGPKPSIEESFAAVVMADVSGYSLLTSTLAERDPFSAEILGKVMKRYLDQIIQVILLHGGDIVKFVGDAVIFYWKVTPNLANLPKEVAYGEVVLKAAICCLDLLKRLGSFHIDIPDCQTKELRIHLGIGAGNVIDVHVGGHAGRWEHFIAGDAMNQLVHVLNIATAGELAMSHSARGYLAYVVDFSTLNIGMYNKKCIILTGLESANRKVPAPVDIERSDMDLWDIADPDPNLCLYKSFINPSALFKLKSDIDQSLLFGSGNGVDDILSSYELRQVTTLFINIGSLKHWEKSALLHQAQSAIIVVQEALAEDEGILRQFHIDEKGAVILCFFGLPPYSHENDASLGIKAGMSICEKFKGMFDHFSMGITTGVVSIGGVGNSVRTEYAVMGDSINMAARIMCHPDAQRSLICDERTRSLCLSEFDFQSLGMTRVKGKYRPISIFRVTKADFTIPECALLPLNNTNIIIGREQEKRAIVEMMEDHINITSLIFEGESGQGLSTIIDFAKTQALKSDYIPMMISLNGSDEAPPLYFELVFLTQLFLLVNNITKPIDEIQHIFNSYFGIMNSPEKRRPSQDKSFISNKSQYESRFQNGKRKDSAYTSGIRTTSESSIMYSRKTSDASSILPLYPVVTSPDTESRFDVTIDLNAISSEVGPPSSDIVSTVTSNEDAFLETYELKLFSKEAAKALKFLGVENVYKYILSMPQIVFGDDSDFSPYMDFFKGRGLSEFLLSLVSWLSRRIDFVLILEDIHKLSTSFYHKLIPLCKHTNMVITSLPPARFEYGDNLQIYHILKQSKFSQFFTVNGLDYRSTIEMIKYSWNLSSPVIVDVSTKICRVIYNRTNGNPLYIRTLVSALKESGLWRLDRYGILNEPSDNFQLETEILSYDIQSAFVSQFDRLDPTFQIFLKIASVFGERFMLNDAIQFISCISGWDIPSDKKDALTYLTKKITTCDKYGFLIFYTNRNGLSLSFRSTVIRDHIYSMMVISRRQKLHLLIAQYYEKLYKSSFRKSLLVRIYTHYNETDNSHRLQKLRYLEAVCRLYYEQLHMKEAIRHYLILLSRAMKVQLEIGYALYDDVTIAIWHRELGHALLHMSDLKGGEMYVLKSMELNKFKIPSKMQMNYKFYKELLHSGSFMSFLANDPLRKLKKSKSLVDRYEEVLREQNIESKVRYRFCNFLFLLPDEEEDFDFNLKCKIVSYKNDNLGMDDPWVSMEDDNPLADVYRNHKDIQIISPAGKQLEEVLRDYNNASDFNLAHCFMLMSYFYSLTNDLVKQRYFAMQAFLYGRRFPRVSYFAVTLSSLALAVWSSEGSKNEKFIRKLLEYSNDYDSCKVINHTAARLYFQAKTYILMGDFDRAALKIDTFLQITHASMSMKIIVECILMRIFLAFFKLDYDAVVILGNTLNSISERMEDPSYKYITNVCTTGSYFSFVRLNDISAAQMRTATLRLGLTPSLKIPSYCKLIAFCNVWRSSIRLYLTTERDHNLKSDEDSSIRNHRKQSFGTNLVFLTRPPSIPRTLQNMLMMVGGEPTLNCGLSDCEECIPTFTRPEFACFTATNPPVVCYIYSLLEGFKVIKPLFDEVNGDIWQWGCSLPYFAITIFEVCNFFITHPHLHDNLSNLGLGPEHAFNKSDKLIENQNKMMFNRKFNALSNELVFQSPKANIIERSESPDELESVQGNNYNANEYGIHTSAGLTASYSHVFEDNKTEEASNAQSSTNGTHTSDDITGSESEIPTSKILFSPDFGIDVMHVINRKVNRTNANLFGTVTNGELYHLIEDCLCRGKLDIESRKAIYSYVKLCKELISGLKNVLKFSSDLKHLFNGIGYMYGDYAVNKAHKEFVSFKHRALLARSLSTQTLDNYLM